MIVSPFFYLYIRSNPQLRKKMGADMEKIEFIHSWKVDVKTF